MQKSLAAVALVALTALSACSSMSYDLADVPFPVRADAGGAPGSSAGEPFAIDSKYVMYVHGLLGEKQPPVAELLGQELAGATEVTDFRVHSGANLWDWLGTHLSLGLVRLKTVRITGRVVR